MRFFFPFPSIDMRKELNFLKLLYIDKLNIIFETFSHKEQRPSFACVVTGNLLPVDFLQPLPETVALVEDIVVEYVTDLVIVGSNFIIAFSLEILRIAYRYCWFEVF